MRLTHFGIKGALFYLAMVGAFLASPYSNLFFLLLGFLTLQWILGAVWTLRNMRGVTAVLADVEPAPAGAGQLLAARLQAPGRTRFQLVCELELSGGERVCAQAHVVDGERELHLAVPPLPRGLHALRRARVRSSYPLGLFSAGRPLEAPSELVVYPAPIEIADARGAGEVMAELLGQHSRSGDLQPSGLRDRRDGDELRTVHWRASARRGTLVVREWEGGGGQGLEVLLDRRCQAEALEEALSVISAMVHLARDDKQVLALHTQGLSATFGAGHRPWREALRFLAGAESLPANGPAPPPVSPSVPRLPLVRSRQEVGGRAG